MIDRFSHTRAIAADIQLRSRTAHQIAPISARGSDDSRCAEMHVQYWTDAATSGPYDRCAL